MASIVSKRAQARNERMLQDLIRTIPGNDRCADCSAKNPGWASWSLGIFLCMRCASLHRKLGTHISKVKSLSMDSWTSEQVDNMKSMGNVLSNKLYNPQNVRPEIPIDIDEAEAAVEKHIRQKYELRTLSGGNRSVAPPTRQNTGSTGTGSWSEEPPALPPKPGKKFGFSLRSASSTFPRQKTDRFTPPLSPARTGSERSANNSSPPKADKPGHMFGMKITTVENNFNDKLAHLRDMGFSNNEKNIEVLKRMNGSLDGAIEALSRLGEESNATRAVTPGHGALTPVSMGSAGTNGITFEKRRESEKKAANNPWDIPEQSQPAIPSQPPRAQSVPPISASWNPFLSQTQQQQPPSIASLEQGFDQLQISQTGPVPAYGFTQQNQLQTANFQQGTNPWQTQQQPVNNTMYSQGYQQLPVNQQPNNPFAHSQAHTQSFVPTNPWASQSHSQPQQQAAAVQQSSNPFGTAWQPANIFQQPASSSPAPIYGQQTDFFSAPQSTTVHQISPQPLQSQDQQQLQQQNFLVGGSQNPWQQQMAPQATSVGQPSFSQLPQHTQAAAQQQYGHYPAQPAPRHDKSSILALYGQSQPAPPRPLQTLPEDGTMPSIPQPLPQAIQRSFTMPAQQLSNSMNPFASAAPAPAVVPQTQSVRHVSNESVDFQGFAANGRHSPDAFAGLSSRYMR